MKTLKSVDEVTRTIEYEMQVNSLWKEDNVGFSGFTVDGLLTVAGIIKKDRTHAHTLLRERLEAEKKDIWSAVDEHDYNLAIEAALSILDEVFGVSKG